MIYLPAATLIGAAFLGWLAGMWTSKRAQRWCSVCGDHLQCLGCLRRSGALDSALKRP